MDFFEKSDVGLWIPPLKMEQLSKYQMSGEKDHLIDGSV